MDAERLHLLLQRHFDEVLSAEERSELERILLASAKARAAFWREAQWHALIRQWGEGEWGREPALPPLSTLPARRRWRPFDKLRAGAFGSRTVLAAAAVVVLAITGWLLWQTVLPTPPPPLSVPLTSAPNVREWSAGGVAVLTRSFDAHWIAPATAPYVGEVLTPGRLQLKSGVIQIELTRGTRLVIEGPAEVQLFASDEIQLGAGKVRASVPPPARGFAIRLPDATVVATVVNRGTELGCVVRAARDAEVHVFSGLAEYHALGGSAPRPLQANEALQSSGGGALHAMNARRDSFVSDETLEAWEATLARQQMIEWRKASRLLDGDPRLLVHLDFEEEHRGARTLSNRAAHAPSASGATLVGCDWVEGRWPGKAAVEFKHANDRLWLNVPGNLEAMTFIAWVRVDSLPYVLHALLTAEGPNGKINWCLKSSGALSFGIEVPHDGRGWLLHKSSARLRPQQLGTWLCLATVYAADGTVTHYLNGEPAGAGRLAERKPGGLGKCEIGNNANLVSDKSNAPPKPSASASEPPKNFLGRMDEFAIFSVALSPEEISHLHAQGRAGRVSLVNPP
jgi:hypothetical protein